MIEQLKLWKHTKVWDKMYNDIMDGLLKEHNFAESMISEYKDRIYEKEILEDFNTRMTKYHLQKIKRYSDYYCSDIENTEKNNQIIKEFEDSLKELESLNNSKEEI
jgi:hypothetical protein